MSGASRIRASVPPTPRTMASSSSRSSSNAPDIESARVVAVHCHGGAVGRDDLDGIGSFLNANIEQLALALRHPPEHVVGTVLLCRGLADADAHAHEVVRVQVLLD